MITRASGYTGESKEELLSTDMGVVFDELNKGIDPNNLPQGKITTDKLRITSPGSGGVAGYRVGSAQIAANSVALVNIGFTSPAGNVGVGSGQYFPATVYVDFYVDPSGAGPVTLPNLSANPQWNGTGAPSANILPTYYLNNSSGTNNIFILTIAVYNFDAGPHWVYASANVCVINTQTSTAS